MRKIQNVLLEANATIKYLIAIDVTLFEIETIV